MSVKTQKRYNELLNEYVDILNQQEWMTTREVSRKARCGIKAVRDHLKEVREADEIEFQPKAGRHGATVYRLSKSAGLPEQDGVASGNFVSAHLSDVSSAQVQPNGIDLTIEDIFRTSGTASFTRTGYYKPERTRMTPDKDGFYNLYPGQYPVVYAEQIKIPDGFVGRVYPRSRLMRSGLHLTSALWDQGYEGVGEGLLQIPKSIEKVEIEVGMPIAQMVFIEATEAADYDGSHQGERIEDKN